MVDGKKKCILLVEDEIFIATFEASELERLGYNVKVVNSGEDAVELVKKSNDIDLILMDINLGKGIDGTEAARLILKDKEIPIVFLSSHNEKEIVEKTEKITSYGYVVKSSGIAVLDASIKMAFRLAEARNLYKNIFIHSINGLCIHKMIYDKNGNPYDCEYLNVNPAFEAQTGLSSEILKGKTIRDLYPSDEVDFLIKLYGEVLTNNKTITKEIFFNPTKKWYELTIFPLGDDVFTVVTHNVTEKKQADEDLKINMTKFKEIFNSVNEAIFIDEARTGKMIEANQRAVDMYGYDSVEDILSGNIGDISANIPPYTEAKAQENIRKAIEEGPQTFDWIARKKDGTTFWVEVSLKYAVIGGEERVIAVVRDISERKSYEERIKKLLEEKEIILKEVHHRIKNNMNTIIALLSLQENEINEEVSKKALADARGRINTMVMLYDMLYKAEKFDKIYIKEYLSFLVDNIVSSFSIDSDITIEKRIEDFVVSSKIILPIAIIVNEIITNSMKYAFVNRKKGEILVDVKKEGGSARIIVKDNGIGIPDISNKQVKSGFGLSLIKMMVKQLKGNFTILNENGTKCVLEFNIH